MTWWKTLFGLQPIQQVPAPKLPHLSDNEDPLYRDAATFVLSTHRPSISAVQQHLKIGYNRAANLIQALEDDGIVSPLSTDGQRHVLSEAERIEWQARPSRHELLRQKQAEELALRSAYLHEKYNNDRVVKQILDGEVWEGMTSGELFDSWGEPEAIDQKYLKNKSREVWKYDHLGGNRYGGRVTLENGIVVGWDIKSPPPAAL